jgi:hypothetical protein
VSNNALKLFGIDYSQMELDNHQWLCSVSKAADVAPLVGNCKKVTLSGAGSKARILASKGVMPLLVLEGGDPSQQQPGMPCWSLVRYGKGWISDPKPVDRAGDDGDQFWRNFFRFCLGRVQIDVPPGSELPIGGALPAAVPSGPLAGVWRASTGAKIRVDDDGKTATIDLIASDALLVLSGKLVRHDESSDSRSFGGTLEAVFRVDPFKRFTIDVTATVVDADHVRLRCGNWPKWNSRGKFLAKDTLTEVLTRSEGAVVPPTRTE